jgi:hypothetical protein
MDEEIDIQQLEKDQWYEFKTEDGDSIVGRLEAPVYASVVTEDGISRRLPVSGLAAVRVLERERAET